MKPKAIESGSNNKSTITQEIYNKILEERIDEILEMRDEIKFKSLTYYFKGTTSPINFLGYGSPMYTYEKLKNGETTLKQVEKEQKDFKTELNKITSGNPDHKSDKQLYTIKNLKIFIIQDQKILIY